MLTSMSTSQIDSGIRELVSQVTDAHILEEGFSGFLVQSAENDKRRRDSFIDMVNKHWTNIPESSHSAAAQMYVQLTHEQANAKRAKLLFDLLETLVEKNTVHAKVICEALLNSDELSIDYSQKWCETFYLVRRIIGGVYYKGTRDLLRVVLEKCQTLEARDNVATARCLDAVINVVNYIIDRNACLLPSYFAVNEIVKCVSGEGKSWPHWKLGESLSGFVQSFRPTAQMVSVFGRESLLPVVGHASATGNVWKLNPSTLRFMLLGPLPYDQKLLEPQISLLRYVLEQPYSRDMVCNILSLSRSAKERCRVLEEQLVSVVVHAMEESEGCAEGGGDSSNQLRWQRLSSQLIFFVLFQFASFPHMVLALYEKLKGRGLRRGRDHLMWVLLQFISGSIQKNPLSDFLPVIKLYDLLYPEKEALAVPDVDTPACTYKMAVTCIWIHINKKAQSDMKKSQSSAAAGDGQQREAAAALQRPIPQALHGHIDFLKQCLNQMRSLNMSDYKIALLCNAYSTNQEFFMMPMGFLVENIYGNNQATTMLPGNVTASAPITPLDMSLLDCLTVHAKMSLIHSIGTKVLKLAQAQSKVALAPALVETYSRLLVYIEIESLGIKGFTTQLLPNVYKSSAWGILHTLLEMFTYRQYHIQPHYRVQLLSHLHYLAQLQQTNQNQLHLCVESTALRLIMGLGNWEVHPQLSRMSSSESNRSVLVSDDSEELNRALVLTLARAMHITGPDTLPAVCCREILAAVHKKTPHSWSSHTLKSFPPVFAEFFEQNPVQREDKSQLKRNVETEYRKWKSMMGENDLISHFSAQDSQPLFLCVLWRSLMEDSRISPTAHRVLEKIGPRVLSRHLRTFADYLVYEFVNPQGNSYVAKCVDSLNDLIWKCNIVPIDRLVLVLALRCLEGSELQVCFFIIQIILLKPADFKNRVNEFVQENSPEHWLQTNWHEKHIAFHTKYPEKFNYEGLQGDLSQQQQPHQYLPLYFSNVCLRFLPVLDIVIHRFLENPAVIKPLESILDHLGPLYKFHDRPITFMYHTLHYFEVKLRERPALKKKLVDKILGYLRETKPGWCVSEEFEEYLKRTDDSSWHPGPDYYAKLVQRLVRTIAGKNQSPFPNCDWRFNEFSNPTAHAVHATCVELMALPVSGPDVGNALMQIVLTGSQMKREEIMSWMNAIGLLLTTLPEPYWTVLHDKILETLRQPILTESTEATSKDLFKLLNFTGSQQVMSEQPCAYVLALSHAVWQHASIGQLTALPRFLKESVKEVVRAEEQLLFVCHLVGPFLQRFHTERTRCLLDLTIELYEMLEHVDGACAHLYHMNAVTDFLYHIKYMFVGDGVKNEVEKVIRKLRPALQLRLRYIAHHGKEDTTPA